MVVSDTPDVSETELFCYFSLNVNLIFNPH